MAHKEHESKMPPHSQHKLTEMTCPSKMSDPPYSTALPKSLLKGAIALQTLGVAHSGRLVHSCTPAELLKNQPSSAGQGPPPLPVLNSMQE